MLPTTPPPRFWTSWLVLLLAALFLAGCTGFGASDAAPAFWTACAAAVSAIPVVGPVLGPVVATAGPMLGTLAGTHGTAAAMGGALVHHHHFGLWCTTRRQHLAPARAAHKVARRKVHQEAAQAAATAKAA